MKALARLAWSELWARRGSTLIAIAVVAAAVAWCTATELLLRAREVAVAAQVDLSGAPLTVLPPGKTGTDLARLALGEEGFSASDLEQLSSTVSSSVRALDPRLVWNLDVAGAATPLVGVDPSKVVSASPILSELESGEVAVGVLVAEQRGMMVGQDLRLGAGALRVVSILPSSGTSSDLALFVRVDTLRSLTGTALMANAVHIYPRAAVAAAEVARQLQRQHPSLAVLQSDRGPVAEIELGGTLAQHRWALYAITSMVVAIAVLVWSFLNAMERRLELAALVAIGTSWLGLVTILSLRAATAGAVGAILGYTIGAAVAVAHDTDAAVAVAWSPSLLLTFLVGSATLAIVGALPASAVAATRNHAKALQL